MSQLDADFVPCSCPTEPNAYGIPCREAERIDGRPAQDRGSQIWRTKCCSLVWAIVPVGQECPPGFRQLRSVTLAIGGDRQALGAQGASPLNDYVEHRQVKITYTQDDMIGLLEGTELLTAEEVAYVRGDRLTKAGHHLVHVLEEIRVQRRLAASFRGRPQVGFVGRNGDHLFVVSRDEPDIERINDIQDGVGHGALGDRPEDD